MANLDPQHDPAAPSHLNEAFEALREKAGASKTRWDAKSGVWEVRGQPSGGTDSSWSVNGVDNDEAWFVCGDVTISVPLRGPSADLASARLSDLVLAFEGGSVVRSERRAAFGTVVQILVPGTLTDGCELSRRRWMTRVRWV